MSTFTALRRGAAAAGATGLIALSLAGPASARPDPGSGEPTHCTSGCFEGGSPATGSTPVPQLDDNGIQLLQLGGGIVAGVALAGAGMAVVSRRNHAHAAHPA